MKRINKIKQTKFFKRIIPIVQKYHINSKKIFIATAILVIFLTVFVYVLNAYYSAKLQPFIKNAADIETLDYRYSALILGAGLNSDGSPSDMLQDRLEVGYELLVQKKVTKLILSGDNREITHNEPESMKNFLIKKGVTESSLVLDYAGRRTYDSCYRAKHIFSQTKIYVISQDFHLVRAVFLCKSLGIDTIGVTADLRSYSDLWQNIVRDDLGMIEAIWDAKIIKPIPVLGPQIKI